MSRVRLGVIPVGRHADGRDGGSPVANEALAAVEVLGAGSRALTLVRRWGSLFREGGSPDDEAWAQLAASATLYREAGVAVLLALAVVDGVVDARPEGVGGWDESPTLDAIEATIDRVFATFGSELAYLAFGSAVDRWLEEATETERASFALFMHHAIDHANAHPTRPGSTVVAVATSFDGAVAPPSPEMASLIAASEVLITTYYPLGSELFVREQQSLAGDLARLAAATGGERPKAVVLQEVGYPTASSVGGSPSGQREFYEGLGRVLLDRRDQFPFVSLFALNDPEAEACADFAASLAAAPDSPAAVARCSMGLREHDGSPKPAWQEVLDLLSTFAAP